MNPLNWWGSAFRRAVKLHLRIQYVYVTENIQTTSVKIANLMYSIMFHSMQALLKAVEYFQLEDAKLCRAVQALAVHCQFVTSSADYTPPSEFVGSVGVLWESPRVREALEKSHDFCSFAYAKEYVYEFNTLNFTKRTPLNSLI